MPRTPLFERAESPDATRVALDCDQLGSAGEQCPGQAAGTRADFQHRPAGELTRCRGDAGEDPRIEQEMLAETLVGREPVVTDDRREPSGAAVGGQPPTLTSMKASLRRSRR